MALFQSSPVHPYLLQSSKKFTHLNTSLASDKTSSHAVTIALSELKSTIPCCSIIPNIKYYPKDAYFAYLVVKTSPEPTPCMPINKLPLLSTEVK